MITSGSGITLHVAGEGDGPPESDRARPKEVAGVFPERAGNERRLGRLRRSLGFGRARRHPLSALDAARARSWRRFTSSHRMFKKNASMYFAAAAPKSIW